MKIQLTVSPPLLGSWEEMEEATSNALTTVQCLNRRRPGDSGAIMRNGRRYGDWVIVRYSETQKIKVSLIFGFTIGLILGFTIGLLLGRLL